MRMLAILAALALAGCATVPSPTSDPLPANARYVAMGSSFAAGPGIGAIKLGTPERCTRAVNNYASLVAQALSLDLKDASCSGATTHDLLEANGQLPAQLDAVTSATRLVTITVGGNDLDYMGLLFTASCRPDEQECAPRVHLPPDDAYDALRARLVEIVRRIHATAPMAQIVFVQYVTLVPEALCEATPIDTRAKAEARELAARLAQVTAEAASAGGAVVLQADRLSVDHTACDSQPWSQGLPRNPAVQGGAPWHPNAAGHAAIAQALVQLLAH